jgi:hypothetical protein
MHDLMGMYDLVAVEMLKELGKQMNAPRSEKPEAPVPPGLLARLKGTFQRKELAFNKVSDVPVFSSHLADGKPSEC